MSSISNIARRAHRLLSLGIAYTPRIVPAVAASRFVAHARMARDARLYEVAAGLLEEALRFTPQNGRIHLQCGHMFKEAREFANAEAHYREAQRLLPASADLAIQLGHFYKVAGRPAEAETAYLDALRREPDSTEAREEVTRIGAAAPSEPGIAAPGDQGAILPELLPREAIAERPMTEGIRILRLGTSRVRSRGGMMRVLRGVEAIRGFCVSAAPIEQFDILLHGSPLEFEKPETSSVANGQNRKYVFNVWFDFADIAPGRRELVLRFVDTKGRVRRYREQVLITPPLAEPLPDSDAALRPGAKPGTVVERVNALPSMIRPVARSPLPDPIRTILVQRADQLGDLACSVPAIQRVRELFPGARIVGLLTVANAELGQSLGLFDAIEIADFPEAPAERRRVMTAESQAALRRTLAVYDVDIAIDFGEGSESRPLLLLSGAKFLYGFKEREFPWLSAGLELNGHDPVNGLEVMPPSRKLLALVEALGAMHHGRANAIRRTDVERDCLTRFGLDTDHDFAVFHTGARLAYSRWPGFAALTALIIERSALDVVILIDDPLEAASFPSSERVHVIAGRMPFDELEALLCFCAVLVGNDSGPKHLAALRGAKVVSLHMARLNWNEWGQEIGGAIISRRVPCAGCAISYDAEECGKSFACIRHIDPEEVYDAIMALI